jgi:hypothetical protein
MSVPANSDDKTPAKKKKPRPPSKKVLQAIDLLISGECETQGAAAEKVGMTREALNRALNRPHVTDVIASKVNKRFRTIGLMKSAAALEHLAHKANSESVRKDASAHLLAIAGVKPTHDKSPAESGGIVLNVVLNGQSAPPVTQAQVIEHESEGQRGLQQVDLALEGGRGDE